MIRNYKVENSTKIRELKNIAIKLGIANVS
mgnify:CR=1 FL=1